MPSSHLILWYPLLLLPSIPPSIRIFSNESTLHMRWPKYWSFSFSIIPSKEIPELISSEWTGWISLQSKGLSRVFSNSTLQKHQFFGAQLSSQSNSHIHTWFLITWSQISIPTYVGTCVLHSSITNLRWDQRSCIPYPIEEYFWENSPTSTVCPPKYVPFILISLKAVPLIQTWFSGLTTLIFIYFCSWS